MGAHYRLACVACGWETGHDRHTIHCPACGERAFLRTHYDVPLSPCGPPGEFASYRDWLPFDMALEIDSIGIGCIRARDMGRELGLEDLWLLLSCWAPEHGATLPACTFKTLEAAGVMMRVLTQTDQTLIVSSAGNAGAAVLEFGARNQKPAIVVVPESARKVMQASADPGPDGPLLLCLKQATYPDAIALVGRIQERFAGRLVREGGAYNVARRDAMGVPVLSAIERIGRIPQHYVQAVGSGTGGIAAHEAVLRLAGSGLHEGQAMQLHLVQNVPFTPMVDAWHAGADTVRPMSPEEVYECLQRTYSTVLANATPPFGVAGGVRDCLLETGGDMVAVENEEARSVEPLVTRHLDMSPYPETAVALAGLRRQVETGRIAASDTVLLHATGGGFERSIADLGKRPYPVGLTIDPDDLDAACAAVDRYLSR